MRTNAHVIVDMESLKNILFFITILGCLTGRQIDSRPVDFEGKWMNKMLIYNVFVL